MTRLYTADYSTGDFLQWDSMANTIIQFGSNYPSEYAGGHPASVISQDKDCGYVARFEVRDGDIPAFGGGQRSEVGSAPPAGGGGPGVAAAGTTRWYAFSVKFDETFPLDHADSWAVTNQFHDDINGYSPTISWGFVVPGNPAFQDVGYWQLSWNQQEADHTYLAVLPILEVPMNGGHWHDVKMQIHWSADDTLGWVKTWLNGAAQTLRGGSTTFTGRTMIPGAASMHYAEGLYRDPLTTATGIVYHTGFRMADSEDSL